MNFWSTDGPNETNKRKHYTVTNLISRSRVRIPQRSPFIFKHLAKISVK